jgi:undecaprenyl pyrophosphate synthase
MNEKAGKEKYAHIDLEMNKNGFISLEKAYDILPAGKAKKLKEIYDEVAQIRQQIISVFFFYKENPERLYAEGPELEDYINQAESVYTLHEMRTEVSRAGGKPNRKKPPRRYYQED